MKVQFGTAPLWMLAGTNGSGKSSVFDAVTYALFGHHRGGSQNAAELINKESASLAVEFDFRLDGQLYRIKRTLRRNAKGAVAGTQQIFHHLSDGTWEPVPDTGKKADFDKWVHDRIGLNESAPMKSWVASHPSRGCSLEALKSTGGNGRFYCFAAN